MQDLKPFQANTSEIRLRADISVADELIEICYKLHDPSSLVQGAPQKGEWTKKNLKRVDELWQKTCFEAFWSELGKRHYWELNLSADGKWNLYFFQSERLPQPPETCSDFEVIRVAAKPGELRCYLRAHKKIKSIELSLCAVLKTATDTYYYSTEHAGEEPNFHLRKSLTLQREIE